MLAKILNKAGTVRIRLAHRSGLHAANRIPALKEPFVLQKVSTEAYAVLIGEPMGANRLDVLG